MPRNPFKNSMDYPLAELRLDLFIPRSASLMDRIYVSEKNSEKPGLEIKAPPSILARSANMFFQFLLQRNGSHET
uniref:Uncharacterized protein n=1 Tax=Candidatus Kentrum sp. LPFa TaxID=2126335 RepID=A0A450WD48_9GAMM|nr:MAG: hypothetical protein BECKLPF1236A_GA0070988_101188 [Candidatus Kentron sp. LPFa]VFK30745.1 MAG: hypothetical protein BECKLPF1236C_GA0070990_101187 [Candidatus Kentron sp. LPFa]